MYIIVYIYIHNDVTDVNIHVTQSKIEQQHSTKIVMHDVSLSFGLQFYIYLQDTHPASALLAKYGPLYDKEGKQKHYTWLVGGWATPLKNMKVNWDDEIPNIWEHKKWQPNHQPACKWDFLMGQVEANGAFCRKP